MTTTTPAPDLAAFEALIAGGSDAAEAVADGGAVVLPPRSTLDPSNPALRSRGILKRRSVPIMGYTGLNGQGKSMCMVRDTLLSLAIGRPILSTVTILDPDTGQPHPLFERFTSWEQLHDFRDGDVLLDEVTGVADARDSGMPKHVRKIIPQLRRRNVMLRWTGIDWDNTDRRLRQLTQAVARCKGHFPDFKAVRTTGQNDAVPMWAPNRYFLVTTFDAQTLQSTEDNRALTQEPDRKRRARILNREWIKGPGSPAFAAYNTLDSVASVDNSCRHCGGRIPERVCKGHA
jgi:hypothetical protein